jgi:hypothetical protein
MALDWIKMRCRLGEDPSVIYVANQCGLDQYAVVGRLHALWSWASEQTLDGNAFGVTLAWLDCYVGVQGFGQTLVDCGWLTVDDRGISFPNWDRHNSESAKKRGDTARRVANHRAKKRNGSDVTSALAREEKNKKKNTPPVVPPVTDPMTPKYPADFQQFWDAYPRKVGKGDALKSWRRIKPSAGLLAKMIAAVRRTRETEESWQREGGRFIPKAATWLNQERWEDEGMQLDLVGANGNGAVDTLHACPSSTCKVKFHLSKAKLVECPEVGKEVTGV